MVKNIELRLYRRSDLQEVVQLFKDSVIEIGIEQYNAEQVKIWSSYANEINNFHSILDEGITYVAVVQGKLVSFGTLHPTDQIAFIYRIKEYSKMGVASKIYKILENHSKQSGVRKIHTEASKIAKHFFLKNGFIIVEKEIVTRNEVEFERYKMLKAL